jgi:hypothetical protein
METHCNTSVLMCQATNGWCGERPAEIACQVVVCVGIAAVPAADPLGGLQTRAPSGLTEQAFRRAGRPRSQVPPSPSAGGAAEGPVLRASRQAGFHGVVFNVVYGALQMRVVTNVPIEVVGGPDHA